MGWPVPFSDTCTITMSKRDWPGSNPWVWKQALYMCYHAPSLQSWKISFFIYCSVEILMFEVKMSIIFIEHWKHRKSVKIHVDNQHYCARLVLLQIVFFIFSLFSPIYWKKEKQQQQSLCCKVPPFDILHHVCVLIFFNRLLGCKYSWFPRIRPNHTIGFVKK